MPLGQRNVLIEYDFRIQVHLIWTFHFTSEETDLAWTLKIPDVISLQSALIKRLLKNYEVFPLFSIYMYVLVFIYVFHEGIKALVNLELEEPPCLNS